MRRYTKTIKAWKYRLRLPLVNRIGPYATARLAHNLARCIVAFAVLATPAKASDYSHTCISADGLYETQDGKLYARADVTQTEIPYQPIAPERLLAERNGYCIAQGKKYEFQLKTYTLDVRITVGGEPRDLRLNCELAADGLPPKPGRLFLRHSTGLRLSLYNPSGCEENRPQQHYAQHPSIHHTLLRT